MVDHPLVLVAVVVNVVFVASVLVAVVVNVELALVAVELDDVPVAAAVDDSIVHYGHMKTGCSGAMEH